MRIGGSIEGATGDSFSIRGPLTCPGWLMRWGQPQRGNSLLQRLPQSVKLASAFFEAREKCMLTDRRRFFTPPVECQLPPCIWDNLSSAQVSNQNSPQLPKHRLPACLPAVDPSNWIIHSEATPVNNRPPHSKAKRRRLKINHSEMFCVRRAPSGEEKILTKGWIVLVCPFSPEF